LGAVSCTGSGAGVTARGKGARLTRNSAGLRHGAAAWLLAANIDQPKFSTATCSIAEKASGPANCEKRMGMSVAHSSMPCIKSRNANARTSMPIRASTCKTG
jgi:hypothetical protein